MFVRLLLFVSDTLLFAISFAAQSWGLAGCIQLWKKMAVLVGSAKRM